MYIRIIASSTVLIIEYELPAVVQIIVLCELVNTLCRLPHYSLSLIFDTL
jgi:hypothetical protein